MVKRDSAGEAEMIPATAIIRGLVLMQLSGHTSTTQEDQLAAGARMERQARIAGAEETHAPKEKPVRWGMARPRETPLGLLMRDGDWLRQLWRVVEEDECNILRIPALRDRFSHDEMANNHWGIDRKVKDDKA
ncbi:hypothetical protein F1880_006899 [Penicillium rolfsii]|nr:hypothetical protein F1880_006899 [Penicillium rolfsii]